MAGRIILGIANPALDANGNVDSGATLTFYQNGTTTPQSIYDAEDLLTPLTNPLACDAAGRFPAIWAESDAVYSVKWTPTGETPITYDDITPSIVVDENTWLPELEFGGSSLGITYGTRAGNFSVIGNRLFFELTIVLTNKGTAVGSADVTLPVAQSGSGSRSPCASSYDFVDLNVGGGFYSATARVRSGAAAVDLFQQGDNVAVTSLTNSNFANNSEIYISGNYRI